MHSVNDILTMGNASNFFFLFFNITSVGEVLFSLLSITVEKQPLPVNGFVYCLSSNFYKVCILELVL